MKWRIEMDLERNPTLARWRGLSPGARLGVGLLAVLLAWLALDQWSWSLARDWSSEADRIERAIEDSRTLASDIPASVTSAAELFGPIEPPTGESEGAEALAQAVVEAVKRQNLSNYSFDAQRASTSLAGAPVMIGGSPQRLSKVSGEVQFEASPEQAAKVIADLEASPAIETISAVRLQRRDADRKVMVRLTVEAWVRASRRSGRQG